MLAILPQSYAYRRGATRLALWASKRRSTRGPIRERTDSPAKPVVYHAAIVEMACYVRALSIAAYALKACVVAEQTTALMVKPTMKDLAKDSPLLRGKRRHILEYHPRLRGSLDVLRALCGTL